jgi:glycosyltransferase involved in cell wall biosynthesis
LILFVSGEYPPDVGGVGDYTARLRLELETLGCRTSVITRHHVRRWDARALLFVLSHARAGVVHIQFQAGAFDLLGDVCLLPLLLRLRRNVRVVTTFHDAREPYLFPKAGALRGKALRLLARSSHAVLAADERDLATLGGPSSHYYQVPIGSNIEAGPGKDSVRAQLGFGTSDLVLVYFGLLNSSKGLDTLLDAFAIVTVRRPDVRLLLLGGAVGASDPTDRQTASDIEPRLARFGERIVRPGYLKSSDLSAHLKAADVAVLPYADGASPRRGSLLTCAEHGLPIISTDPVSPAVADAVLGVPAGSANALADAVLRVADDPDARERLRAGSAALALRCNWRTIAERHLAIYGELGCWPTH